jgi:hypothetical protein
MKMVARPVGIGIGVGIVVALASALAQTGAVLQVPFGSTTELASPNQRQVLYLLPFAAGVRDAPELWIRDAGTGQKRRLIAVGSTARAAWAPDGGHFYVADHNASDSTLSYIYAADGTVLVDLRATLSRADAELQPYATGHVYVDIEGWVDSQTVRASWFGHTDASPVQCFAFTYSVGVRGKVTRVSKQPGSVAEHGCPDRPVSALR